MTREDFHDFVDSCQTIDTFIEKLNEIGLEFRNNEVVHSILHIQYLVICRDYGVDGLDWFSWWMYELPALKKKELKESYASEPDGTPIILDTVDQMYDFLENIKTNNG